MADTPSTDNTPPSSCQPIETRMICPICTIALPLDPIESIYEACCGKTICRGCSVGHRRAQINQDKLRQLQQQSHGNVGLEMLEFQWMVQTENVACAFCRTQRPLNPKEFVERLHVRVDKYNDAVAMNQLGDLYIDGRNGLKMDKSKAMELYKRSYDLGSPEAADRLSYYSTGSEKKLEYLKEGARRGHINQSLELGMTGLYSGIVEKEYAVSLIVRAARAGDDEAMTNCWKMFKHGYLSKNDLESTMRAKQAALDEVNNEERKYAMRFHSYCNSIQKWRN